MSQSRPAQFDADNARDAVAWIEANLRSDETGMTTITQNSDDAGLLRAVTAMTVGLMLTTMTPAGIVAYLDLLRAGIPHTFAEGQQ